MLAHVSRGVAWLVYTDTQFGFVQMCVCVWCLVGEFVLLILEDVVSVS